MSDYEPDVFYLKFRDTLPILEVTCRDKDGNGYDLTGKTLYLNVTLNDGSTFQRVMTNDPDQTTNPGKATYAWTALDWDTNESDFLIAGPELPLSPDESEHEMEYEAVGAGGDRQTFPNWGHDILRISPDLGQGA